jgi:ADP-ribose pyrophosphatase YjhB (NUDIX family)
LEEPTVADTPKHSVSVAGIVVREDGRILAIQRRDNNHWEPPGGVLELNETLEEGVRREVREETGVNVHVERLTGVYKNMPRGIVALVFLCHPLSTAAPSTDEASRTAWLTLHEITRDMSEAYSIRVTDALLDRAQSRAHNGIALLADRTSDPDGASPLGYISSA